MLPTLLMLCSLSPGQSFCGPGGCSSGSFFSGSFGSGGSGGLLSGIGRAVFGGHHHENVSAAQFQYNSPQTFYGDPSGGGGCSSSQYLPQTAYQSPQVVYLVQSAPPAAAQGVMPSPQSLPTPPTPTKSLPPTTSTIVGSCPNCKQHMTIEADGQTRTCPYCGQGVRYGVNTLAAGGKRCPNCPNNLAIHTPSMQPGIVLHRHQRLPSGEYNVTWLEDRGGHSVGILDAYKWETVGEAKGPWELTDKPLTIQLHRPQKPVEQPPKAFISPKKPPKPFIAEQPPDPDLRSAVRTVQLQAPKPAAGAGVADEIDKPLHTRQNQGIDLEKMPVVGPEGRMTFLGPQGLSTVIAGAGGGVNPFAGDEDKPFVTVVAETVEDATPVLKLFEPGGQLDKLKDAIRLKWIKTKDWPVDREGLKPTANPTILVQAPGGEVYWREDNGIHDSNSFIGAVRHANPKYDPALDPSPSNPSIFQGISPEVGVIFVCLLIVGVLGIPRPHPPMMSQPAPGQWQQPYPG